MRRAISYVVDIELLQRRQQCRRDAHGMKERLNLASAFFIAHFTLRRIVRLGLSPRREAYNGKNAGVSNHSTTNAFTPLVSRLRPSRYLQSHRGVAGRLWCSRHSVQYPRSPSHIQTTPWPMILTSLLVQYR